MNPQSYQVSVMQNRNSLNIGGIIFLIILIYLLYRILLHSDLHPFSILAVQTTMNHWVKHWHFLVVGLIPVYIAIVFFGAVLLGIFFGKSVQRWVSRFWQ
jgi:hypothetical protein